MIDRDRGSEQEKISSQRVVIVMGSASDESHCRAIAEVLEHFGVDYHLRVGSAHKTPDHVREVIQKFTEEDDTQTIFIAVAGRSNALGGFIDGQTVAPVISCPPYSDKFGGNDIYSSLRMPSGIAAVTAIEAEMAALMAIKIFALNNHELADKFLQFQHANAEKILKADQNLNSLH